MGIKGWLAIGGVVLTGIAVWLGVKKKEDEHYDKIQKLIRDVDRKEPEKEETTEKIIDDIEKSFREMGLDNEADAYVQASEAIMDMVAKELGSTKEEMIQQGKTGLEKLKGMSVDELMKAQEEFDKTHPELKVNEGIKIVDNSIELKLAQERKEEEARQKELEEKMKDPEWVAEQERLRKEQEEKKEADWKRKVKKAVEQKNFSRLEDLFDEKYAGGPWHPSPASVFGDAVRDGVIDDVFYNMASEYFGKLWCYSGD